ncbi:hypothetical protein [Nitrincola lacisaponensis]|nr:hypothetical protein [Nitrincola lacisaponensis]
MADSNSTGCHKQSALLAVFISLVEQDKDLMLEFAYLLQQRGHNHDKDGT